MLTDDAPSLAAVFTAVPKSAMAASRCAWSPKKASRMGNWSSISLQPGQAAEAMSMSSAVSTATSSPPSLRLGSVDGACGAPPSKPATVRQPLSTVQAGRPYWAR
jgi:hypothetical protein